MYDLLEKTPASLNLIAVWFLSAPCLILPLIKTLDTKKEKIAYLINKITDTKINVFFGSDVCIKVVERFNSSLNKLTPEEDFILGTMLGYSKLQQCERYLRMKDKFSAK